MINLYNIDCMDFIKDKTDDYYDLCVTDPPYGIGKVSGTVNIKRGKNKYNEYENAIDEIVTMIINSLRSYQK